MLADPQSLVDLLIDRASQEGSRLAYVFEGEPRATLTYGDLHAAATRTAFALRSSAPRATVAAVLHRSGPEFIQAFFGCLYAGIVAVPLPVSLSQTRSAALQTIVADSRADVVLTSDGLRARMAELRAYDGSAPPIVTTAECAAASGARGRITSPICSTPPGPSEPLAA